MKYIDKGQTIKEAHEVFEVGRATIKGWRKLRKKRGELENRPLKRKHKKIDPEQLKAYVSKNPDSYLREIAEEFKCSEAVVFLAFKRLKITRKKTKRFTERNETIRAEFLNQANKYRCRKVL